MRNVGDLTEGVMGLRGRQGSGGSMWVTEYGCKREKEKEKWIGYACTTTHPTTLPPILPPLHCRTRTQFGNCSGEPLSKGYH